MRTIDHSALHLVFALAATAAARPLHPQAAAPPAPAALTTGSFGFSFDVVVPGKPEKIYDMLTGDVSGWWDHTFSGKPAKLYLEAKPGGGFFEIFNASGDGARHAVVIYAERGKRIRFEGPLGLSGAAITLVNTYDLAAAGDSTKITFTAHGTGEMIAPNTGQLVEGVWRHFLIERFRPYAIAHR